MPTDYDKIREENIRMYGESTHHLELLAGQLYTDRTHFIFELLQNAEDAKARKIVFNLGNEVLEVQHDGNPFDESDVLGICGVADSKKPTDRTKIGKFGIGFKSVYAYTAQPEIHSGDEHFCIRDFVRPFAIDAKPIGEEWTTLFHFPLGKKEIPSKTSVTEIDRGLRNLNPITLLFLKNIECIDIKIQGKDINTLKRKPSPYDPARRVTISTSEGFDSEDWLIYEKPVSIPDSESGKKNAIAHVEIAFNVSMDDNGGIKEICNVENTRLVVFFPTDKETHVGFLIQGPYVTTPPRDNVLQDNDWNIKLVQETAELLVFVLTDLKEKGLLKVSALKTLPIRSEFFPEENMFFPLYEAVADAFSENELLPTSVGTFASAENSRLGRSRELRKLFNSKQLGELYQIHNQVFWLNGEITVDKSPELHRYLNEDLKIDEIRPEYIVGELTEQFFASQSDDWISEFYVFAGKNKVQYMLQSKPFIRLQDGSHIVPFDEKGNAKAFLPSDEQTDTSFPVVKTEIWKNEEAREFLVEFGIPEVDIVEDVIENTLSKYQEGNAISEEENLEDLALIMRAFSTDSGEKKLRLERKLKETPFVLLEDSQKGNPTYGIPDELYFPSEKLKMYFDKNDSAKFASSIYSEFTELEFLAEIGVENNVRISKKQALIDGIVYIRRNHRDHVRGLNYFDPTIKVDGLEFALDNITEEKSAFIWNFIALPNVTCICGKIESCTRQNFSGSEINELCSEFGELLRESEWLPIGEGRFRKPSESKLSDLSDKFSMDEHLARQLGMMKNEIADFLATAGVSIEDIDLLKQHYEEFQEWKESISFRNQNAEFPDRPVQDEERRSSRLTTRIDSAEDIEYESRTRSVRISGNSIDEREWLKNHYTNDDQIMMCQVCEEEMPFKKRDGEYYFEAVRVFTGEFLIKEIEQQFLALCPVCSAMYREFVKSDSDAMENLKDQILDEFNNDATEFPLEFGEIQAIIRFSKAHIFDLRQILRQ